jgi:16S rRNA (guanine966-N2)-methyltransferase
MKLFSPETDLSRPILDRVKQSLFDVLQKYDLPAGATVADIFSGVGSLGLEALSRGAEFVVFYEKNPRIASILKKNISKADFEDRCRVVMTDAFKTGAVPLSDRPKYNLVFVDPPYVRTNDVDADSDLAGLMKILVDQTADNALVIVRTYKGVTLLDSYAGFKTIERRQWGSMAVTFLMRSKDEQ